MTKYQVDVLKSYYRNIFKSSKLGSLFQADYRRITFAYNKFDIDNADVFYDNYAQMLQLFGFAMINTWYPIGG